VRRVSALYWRACVDSHVLGCWIGRERAMAEAEEAVALLVKDSTKHWRKVMARSFASLMAALTLLASSMSPVLAADPQATVRVALLDMSATMPMGMMGGYGMMGPGMMGSPGMGGYGMGQGMMMGGMSIRIDQPTIKAGAVTFDVTNWSRSVLHEMLIVAVDNPTAPLPYDYSLAQVAEDQVKVLGEVADLQPNASDDLEVTLPAGAYLLICNVPGHYAAGMVTMLNVTP
jgi:uncharacterized cupredoxin-like copper-binding protein